MSNFRSLIDPSAVEIGDIIQFKTQGTLMERRKNPWSYGYVHQIEYDSQNKDAVVSLRVLPVLNAEQAKKTEFRSHIINAESVGSNFGLDPNQTWAALLSPVRILPDFEHLGQRRGLLQRLGKIAGTDGEFQLIEKIEDTGGESAMLRRAYGAPGFAKTPDHAWGVYIPVGITKDRFEEAEFVHEPKKTRRKSGPEGKVLDIDLGKAVDTLGLQPAIAKIFLSPEDSRAKPLTSLRAVFEMASKTPDALDKYITDAPVARDVNIQLQDLKGTEIHIGVVNGLATPRANSRVSPITDLKSAYHLVTTDPDALSQYSYLGARLKEYAIEDITEAYESRAGGAAIGKADVIANVKKSWAVLTGAYMESLQTNQVPEQFLDENREPVWTFVPKVG